MNAATTTESDESFDYVTARKKAIEYWERCRWIYVGLLIPPTLLGLWIGRSASGIGEFDAARLLAQAIMLGVAVVAANVMYSLVYVIEFLFLGTRKHGHYAANIRPMILILGCILGMLLSIWPSICIAMS